MASFENDVCLNYWCGIKSCERPDVINEITFSVGKQPLIQAVFSYMLNACHSVGYCPSQQREICFPRERLYAIFQRLGIC